MKPSTATKASEGSEIVASSSEGVAMIMGSLSVGSCEVQDFERG